MLWSKNEKMRFFESLSSFPNEIDKKSKSKTFTSSSLTLWARRAASSSNGGFRGRCPLPWSHVGRACKKTTLFWRKLNELSENVSFDSEFALGFEIQSQFKVSFFYFFLMPIFQSILVLNGLNNIPDNRINHVFMSYLVSFSLWQIYHEIKTKSTAENNF